VQKIFEAIQLNPNAVTLFGIFLMFGVLGGIMATRIKWLPTITAFMLLGFIIGPHCLGLVNKEVLVGASVLTDIALGLILYKLGNMLHPYQMVHSRNLLLTSLLESSLTFFCVSGLMIVMDFPAPIAIIIGAIAVSSSPAVLVHVSEELRAEGPVTERAKSLVALNNLFSFFIFSLVLPFSLMKQEADITTTLLLPAYRLVGAVAVAIAISWLASRINRLLTKDNEHYRFAIIIGAVMLTIGLCGMLSLSTLLAPLVLGIATRWFETRKHNLSSVGLGEGGDLFYIILFVMAGAKIDPSLIWGAGLVPIMIAVVRSLAKIVGVYASSFTSKFTRIQTGATSLLLLPMAGMAIGLVSTTNNLVPEIGSSITTLVFAIVVLFETAGPFAAAFAFRICGEAGKADEKKEA
jgi:Kef-type K+ transport system membrane component KefB